MIRKSYIRCLALLFSIVILMSGCSGSRVSTDKRESFDYTREEFHADRDGNDIAWIFRRRCRESNLLYRNLFGRTL